MTQEATSQSVMRRGVGKRDDMDDESSVASHKVSRSRTGRRAVSRRRVADSESDVSNGAPHQVDEVSQENDDDDFDQVSAILKPQGEKRDKESFDNEYDEACSKLQLNATPDELPCRDSEQEHIESYIR